jgi:probable rRNA maturation factor
MAESGFCIISNKTKSKLPRLPFIDMKDKILGTDYQLGLTFISSQKQRSLNYNYRKINKTTNILSFPLSENSGDITIDPIEAKRDAPLFFMDYSSFLKYLFIHGLLHLKGYKHSSTMVKEERKYFKLFS